MTPRPPPSVPLRYRALALSAAPAMLDQNTCKATFDDLIAQSGQELTTDELRLAWIIWRAGWWRADVRARADFLGDELVAREARKAGRTALSDLREDR